MTLEIEETGIEISSHRSVGANKETEFQWPDGVSLHRISCLPFPDFDYLGSDEVGVCITNFFGADWRTRW